MPFPEHLLTLIMILFRAYIGHDPLSWPSRHLFDPLVRSDYYPCCHRPTYDRTLALSHLRQAQPTPIEETPGPLGLGSDILHTFVGFIGNVSLGCAALGQYLYGQSILDEPPPNNYCTCICRFKIFITKIIILLKKHCNRPVSVLDSGPLR